MDADAVRDLQSEDRLKLKSVYLRYRNEFISFGKKYGLDQEALQDIYQEAFIALRKKAMEGRLDTVQSSLKTYLFGIGKYKIFDDLKKRKREVRLEPHLHGSQDEIPEIAVTAEEPLNERQSRLRLQLQKLGEKCRKLLTLFYYRGLSIKEIVDVGGYKNPNVVKAHKSRCLKTLREMMI